MNLKIFIFEKIFKFFLKSKINFMIIINFDTHTPLSLHFSSNANLNFLQHKKKKNDRQLFNFLRLF